MAALTTECVAAMRAAGLNVFEMPGWQNRGESGRFSIQGILLHHDAMGLDNNNVPAYMSQDGVSGAQLWIKRNGQVWILAAGLKWHAGAGGGFRNIPAQGGNAYCVGIETDYTGSGPRDPRIDAAIHLVTRVLVQYYGMNPQRDLALHKEYAPDRKVDLANFDADVWRSRAAGGGGLGTMPATVPGSIDLPDITTIEDDDMPYSPQELKQFAHDGTKWALEDPNVDPIIIRAIVQQEVDKALSALVGASPANKQAFKDAVHQGVTWGIDEVNARKK